MRAHELLDSTYFRPGESTTPLQTDRIKPKLRNFGLTFDVNMWRFIAVTCVEEEPVGPNPQYCRHLLASEDSIVLS